jgi:hypothetical protein
MEISIVTVRLIFNSGQDNQLFFQSGCLFSAVLVEISAPASMNRLDVRRWIPGRFGGRSAATPPIVG